MKDAKQQQQQPPSDRAPVADRGKWRDDKGKEGEKKKEPRETDPEKMTPKERQRMAKITRQWRVAMDFLFRHLAVITFRFNVFFVRQLTDFANAMDAGDEFRAQMKRKKSDKPRITSIKTMLETAEALDAAGQKDEAARLQQLVDLSGRIRTWGLMANDYHKLIMGVFEVESQEDEDVMDSMTSHLNGIQSYTNRGYDFSQAKFVHKIDLSEFTEMEKVYLNWPVAVRSALFSASQYLKLASEVTSMPILEENPTGMLKEMQAAEFLMALNLDDALNERSTEDEQQMALLLGQHHSPPHMQT